MINHMPIRALVVDDEAIVNSLVQLQLKQLGYAVIGSAYDGPEAVRLTEALRPDVVVMDLRMANPETGQEERTAGLKAANEIQQRCPTPVVVLTAYESHELVKQASAIGVGAYLVKPTKDQDLERAITIALARFRDFMELRRLNAELALYHAELDAFAGAVAQGLKTPLKIILEHTESLLQQPTTCSRQTMLEQVKLITRQSYTILNISKELLLLARLRRAGNIEIYPLNMNDIVKRAKSRLQGLPEWPAVEITLPDSWPNAEGHEPWVEEIWVSYLSNAVKYGLPPRPPFRIELGADQQEHDKVRFWVRDFGPGVPEALQNKIFKPLEQLTQVQGEGLSLHFVRYLVGKMGGQAGVSSPVPAGETETDAPCGSLFYFTLPEAPTSYHPPQSITAATRRPHPTTK